MRDLTIPLLGLPSDQQAIWDKCFHPSGSFIEFPIKEIEQSIVARFEKIVAVYPERVAIKTKDRNVTYGELNNWANCIAVELLARAGVGPSPVALLFGKDVRQYAAILAVLKAGKMYEVVEPSYPAARIRFILDDLQATLLVTDSAHLSLARSVAQRDEQIFNVETVNLQRPAENLGLAIHPEALAWIHYTSASTGQPKGVLQNQRNVLNRVMRDTNHYHICPDDRFIFPASRGGDMFLALLNGASLCTLDIRKEGLDRLQKRINDDEVTVYASVTSMFRYFVNHLKPAATLPTLRIIKLIGEPLYKNDVELFRKHIAPRCAVVNRLGSNETGTICEFSLDAQTPIPEQVVPVGYPVEDVEVRLLDNDGNTVGHNEIGEIAVRSRYLSPGYWNNPALTKASYIADPVGSGYVTYRIGDLGRRLADGSVMHLGRKDFQVKILGNRVEIPEVEGALLSLGHIKEVAVVDHDDEQGNKRLVAYFVPIDEKVIHGKELQIALARQLPSFMIPATFVAMNRLPLTGMGKVDRRSLPSPDIQRLAPKSSIDKPRTPQESMLVKIWTDALGRDKVGIHDNFFDLGGQSLMAIRLVSEIEKTFDITISVAKLLQAPTVAQLADAISEREKSYPSPLITIQPNGSKPPFFCAHGTNSYLQLSHQLGSDQPFYGLAQHLEGRKVRHTSIEGIAAHYLRAVRGIQPEGPYYIAGHSLGGLIAFEMAHQIRKQEQEVGLLVLLDARSPGTRLSDTTSSVGNRSTRSGRDLRRQLWAYRQGLKGAWQKKFKTAACQLYHCLGISLPTSLQTYYVDQVVYGNIYSKARRGYVPEAYRGAVAYLKSEDPQERTSGWETLIPAGLKVYQVPGDHLSMLAEPNLGIMAQTLKKCLAEAQTISSPATQFGSQSSSSPREQKRDQIRRELKPKEL